MDTKFVKFVIFSLSAGVIQMGSYAFLSRGLNLEWAFSYLPSQCLSILWNFFLNYNYTFKSNKNKPIALAKIFAFYCVFLPTSLWLGDVLIDKYFINDIVVVALIMCLNLTTEYLYQSIVVYSTMKLNKRKEKTN